MVRPEAFRSDDTSADVRAEILRTVGHRIGGLASIVAFDRFAVIQQNLIAQFRNSVFKVARGHRVGTYVLFLRHLRIQQRILTSRVFVQSLLAGLARSKGQILRESYAGNASYFDWKRVHVHVPDPFLSSLEQRYSLMLDEMDRIAGFLSSLLATRNLVATYVFTAAILFVSVLGLIGFDNIRQWVSTEWSAIQNPPRMATVRLHKVASHVRHPER